MKSNQTWSRRRFSTAVISAQLLLASGSLTLPLSCAKTKKSESDSVLDNSQQDTLKLAMDEVIPANAKMPSASQIGGAAYVLDILNAMPDLIPLFETLILEINELSVTKFDMNFSGLKTDERVAVLKSI